MRGDSLRDLYAKTVALVGLGVLAGTGALVDYWPASRVDLPAAEPVVVVPEFAWAPLPAAPVEPVSVTTAVSPVPGRLAAAPAPFAAAAPVLELTSMMPVFVDALDLADAPADVLRPVAWTSATHTEVGLSDFEMAEPVETLTTSNTRVAMVSASADDDDWWITSAAKRTGASIAKTGVRTGASVVELFRAVNRAVRRAWPN